MVFFVQVVVVNSYVFQVIRNPDSLQINRSHHIVAEAIQFGNAVGGGVQLISVVAVFVLLVMQNLPATKAIALLGRFGIA